MRNYNKKFKKQKSFQFGKWAEYWAIFCLICCGYRLVKKNYDHPLGQVDAILAKGKQLIFLEVKSRSEIEKGFYGLTRAQTQRITNAARAFIAQNRCFNQYDIRFDLIIVNRYFGLKHCVNYWQDYFQ